jgi:putative membrane protein
MPSDTSTRLAVDRTRLAYERTVMAWIRTAVAMISFGFTIYKFFQFELAGRPPVKGAVMGPRGFALLLIGIGLIALLASIVQQRQSLRTLRAEFGGPLPTSIATVVAGLMTVFGLVAFVTVILRG